MEHKGIGCKCREVRRWLPIQETQASIGTILRKKRARTLLPTLALGLVFFAEQETFREIFLPSILAQVCNLSTQEAETGGS